MSQFFTLLTKTGQGLLANAIAYGEPLTIATMAIGDGGGTLPSPDASVTRLINEVRRGPINQTTTDPDNPNWTVVEQVLPPDVGGWTIREVGLYDTDGNLIAYGNYPETYKPQLSEGSSRTQTIRFVMEVTDTSAVTLKIDPSVVMASRQYVDDRVGKHVDASAAHTADQIGLLTPLTAFGDTGTVQAVLDQLGGAARRDVGLETGQLMEVGAFGIGGVSRPTYSTNMDRLCERTEVLTLANSYTNGPGGADAQTYTGQLLVLRRAYQAGTSVVQIAFINGDLSGRWERHADGWDSATNLPAFGAWHKTAMTTDIASAINALNLGSAATRNVNDFASPGDLPSEAGYDQSVAMTDRTTFLSPFRLASAFSGSNRNFGSNGYQILPSGLILQWGTQEVNTYQNFAMTFPNACRSITLTDYGALNTGDLSADSVNQGGFRVRSQVSDTGIVYYQAIGY